MPLRSYDPAIARWTTMDPVVHYNYSPYSAFDNNPVYWSDPSGTNSWGGDYYCGFTDWSSQWSGYSESDAWVDNYWSNNGPQWTTEANLNITYPFRALDDFGNRINESITGGNTQSLVARAFKAYDPNRSNLWRNNGSKTKAGFGFVNDSDNGGFISVFHEEDDFYGYSPSDSLMFGESFLRFLDGETIGGNRKRTSVFFNSRRDKLLDDILGVIGISVGTIEQVRDSKIGDWLKRGKAAKSAGATKILDRVLGAPSILNNGISAYKEFSQGHYYEGSVYALKTTAYTITTFGKLTPYGFVIGTAFNILDASGVIDSALGIKEE